MSSQAKNQTDISDNILELNHLHFSYEEAPLTKVPNQNVTLDTSSYFEKNSSSKVLQNKLKNTLADISLRVKKGETILLTGPSGSGKSTLIRAINGLIPNFYEGELRGEIKFLGQRLTPGDQVLPDLVATVFQNPRTQFFSTDTTAELAFNCENLNVTSEEILERIAKYTQLCHTEKLLNRSVFALSGGEKQILATTAAIVSQPQLYLFDEPSANLDPEAITRLRAIFQSLRQQNATMVINEHRLYWLKDLVDRVLYLEEGQITRSYSGEDFFSLPAATYQELGLRTLNPPQWVPDFQINGTFTAAPTATKHSFVNNTADISHSASKELLSSTPSPQAQLPAGITLNHISFSYQKSSTANPLLSLEKVVFKAGEISLITGENGVGKSTLAQIICGLKQPNSGFISNTATQKKLSAKQLQQLSFQVMQECPHQLFTSSCIEEIALSGCSPEQVHQLLDKYRLSELAFAHPQTLSGGEMQRLCLALAESLDKEIYVFDEPTSGLDASHLSQVKTLVTGLAQSGKVVLIITHDQELIASLPGVVYNMNRL